jgi:hypothetical protein
VDIKKTRATAPKERWESVSPKKALSYLKKNFKDNRNLRKLHVDRLSNDMRDGRWAPHALDTRIAFDTDGRLIDGQHTLRAIIESGKTIDLRIMYECDPSIVWLLDQSVATRTVSDICRITSGQKVTNTHSSCARVALVGPRRTGEKTKGGIPKDVRAAFLIGRWDEIDECVKMSCSLDGKLLYHSGWIGAFLTAWIIEGKNAIQPLIQKLVGQNFKDARSDPARALHSYLTYQKIKVREVVGDPMIARTYYAAVQAIKAHLAGKGLRKIKPEIKEDLDGARWFRAEMIKEYSAGLFKISELIKTPA